MPHYIHTGNIRNSIFIYGNMPHYIHTGNIRNSIFIYGNMPLYFHMWNVGNSIFPYEICHHIFIQEIQKIPYFTEGNLPPYFYMWNIEYSIFHRCKCAPHFHMWNKENINAIFSNMNLQILILREESQKAKTSTIWHHLYVESKIWHKWTYSWNRNRLTDTEI